VTLLTLHHADGTLPEEVSAVSLQSRTRTRGSALLQHCVGQCKPVADRLAQSFSRASDFGEVVADNRKAPVAQTMPSKLFGQGREANPLTPLPAFSGPARGRLPMPLQGALQDNPVPLVCWECGKALVGKRHRFCSNECARAFPTENSPPGRRILGPPLAFNPVARNQENVA
jgi:hypothetical protein